MRLMSTPDDFAPHKFQSQFSVPRRAASLYVARREVRRLMWWSTLHFNVGHQGSLPMTGQQLMFAFFFKPWPRSHSNLDHPADPGSKTRPLNASELQRNTQYMLSLSLLSWIISFLHFICLFCTNILPFCCCFILLRHIERHQHAADRVHHQKS